MTISTLSHTNLIIEFVITRRTASLRSFFDSIVCYCVNTSKGQTQGKAEQKLFMLFLSCMGSAYQFFIGNLFFICRENADEDFILTKRFCCYLKNNSL